MRGVPRARRAISAQPGAVDGDAQDAGRPLDDRLEVGGRVVVEPGDEAEAVAQRAGDRAGAGGGAHQREAGQVEADRPGRGALAQHDVELEVLHRRVEDLLDRAGQAVDLVDEQHVALVELGEDGGQVAGPLERRARGDLQVGAQLGGDDAGQRRLAQAGRARRTAGGRAAWPRRRAASSTIAEVLLELGLAHEVGQPPGPQRGLGRRLLGARTGVEQLLAHGLTAAAPPGAGAPCAAGAPARRRRRASSAVAARISSAE